MKVVNYVRKYVRKCVCVRKYESIGVSMYVNEFGTYVCVHKYVRMCVCTQVCK